MASLMLVVCPEPVLAEGSGFSNTNKAVIAFIYKMHQFTKTGSGQT